MPLSEHIMKTMNSNSSTRDIGVKSLTSNKFLNKIHKKVGKKIIKNYEPKNQLITKINTLFIIITIF